MSVVQKMVDELRAKADFLALHRVLLDAYSYDAGMVAWRRDYTARNYSQDRSGEGPSAWVPGEYDWPRGASHRDLNYVGVWVGYSAVELTVHGPKAKEIARTIRRAMGGTWDKEFVGEQFKMVRPISPDNPYLKVAIEVERDVVCVAKVVGQEPVTIPAVEATEAQPEKVVYKDVIEYDCGNLLEDAVV